MALKIRDKTTHPHDGGVAACVPLDGAGAAMLTQRFADAPDGVRDRAIARTQFARHGGIR